MKINTKMLRRFCTSTEPGVAGMIGAKSIGTKAEPLYFRDNGSDVLAVAHLDWVQTGVHEPQVVRLRDRYGAATEIFYHGALDDRLGAYIVGHLLPSLNINVDVLLTSNEERAASTARTFKPGKQYNWIVSFDRAGTDVVGYQYQYAKGWQSAIHSIKGLSIGNGTYSDIADLDANCLGFNWGTGYHSQHTAYCYADLFDTTMMVNKFGEFYAAYATTALPYSGDARARYSTLHAGNDWEDIDWSQYGYDNDKLDTALRARKPYKSRYVTWQEPAQSLAIVPVAAPDEPNAERVDDYDACAFCGTLSDTYFDDETDSFLCATCLGRGLTAAASVIGRCRVCLEEATLLRSDVMRGYAVCAACDTFEALNQHTTAERRLQDALWIMAPTDTSTTAA